jgi:hypothetical protein
MEVQVLSPALDKFYFCDSLYKCAHIFDMGRSLEPIRNEFLLAVSLAPIAQLVEQLPLKEMVQGSNPCGRTNLKKFARHKLNQKRRVGDIG